MIVTYVGRATFLIQTATGNVLTDPIWPDPLRLTEGVRSDRKCDGAVPFNALPLVRTVLISHDHPGHLDLNTLRVLAACHDPTFVVGLRVGRFLRARGLRRVVELDWWQVFNPGGLSVTMTPAQHGSGRHPLIRNRTLWGGFVVETVSTRVFFAGDTGYAGHFDAVRARWKSIDVALLPVTFEAVRKSTIGDHLTPDEALDAHCALGARQTLAMHCDGPLTADRVLAAFRAALTRHAAIPESFSIARAGEPVVVRPERSEE